MLRGIKGAAAPSMFTAAPGIGARNDDGTERSIRRQVRAVVVATILLVGIFLTATVNAVFVIDGASIEADRGRAVEAVRLATMRGAVLDDAMVRWIEDTFALKGARLVAAGAVRAEQTAVPAGDKVLAFTPRRLGTETFRKIAAIRLLLGMAVVTAIVLVLYRLRALARHIEGQRRLAQSLAGMDPLTGLGNRLDFNEKLAGRVEDASAGKGRAALLLIDLDDFKQVNDRLGHVAGDRLLQEVAQRLRAHAAPGDTVARLGGDEFAIIRSSGLSRSELDEFAGGLLRLISAPCAIDGATVSVAASVGIASIGPGTPGGEAAIRAADRALYRAKARRGGTYDFAQSAGRSAVMLPERQAA